MQTGRNARALMLAGGVLVALTAWAVAPASAQSHSEAGSPALERALESRTKGDPDAGIVVFEIADFQCPYCAQFAGSVAPELDELYVETGKVQWVFVNMPLPNHPLAWHAAEAALCTGVAGGRFWDMHDRLFEQQQSWSSLDDPAPRFAEYAASFGAGMDRYRACVAGDEVAALILQDVSSAVSARVDGTPTFIVMKGQTVVQRMMGVQPVEEWSRMLDEALQ